MFWIPTVNTNYVHYNFVVAKPQVGITLSNFPFNFTTNIQIYFHSGTHWNNGIGKANTQNVRTLLSK